MVVFTSRNKDNANVEGFKQRRISFLYHLPSPYASDVPESLAKRFASFVRDGVLGETCRMYISVNARNPEKIRASLMHHLVDSALPGRPFTFTHMDAVMASIGGKKECAAERKWLIDFDLPDRSKADAFATDLQDIFKIETQVIPTMHNFAIVCSHGFDTRLLDESPSYRESRECITFKKDAMLCVGWRGKGLAIASGA